MASVPRVFRQAGETVIASYDYTDIEEGTGIVKYYGAVTDDAEAGTNYILTTDNSIYSWDIEKKMTYSDNNNEYQTIGNFDFDTGIFKKPRTIKGTAFVNLNYYSNYMSPDPYTKIYVIFKKYDGTDETTIATLKLTDGEVTEGSRLFAAEKTLPETVIKRGEKLRINVLIQFRRNSDTNVNAYVGMSPRNRDGTEIVPSTNDNQTTQMIFSIPFELDV